MPIRPKKSLGQHFLKDENIARKIVNSLEYELAGSVLEVGPGTGILTKYIFGLGDNINLIEIDKDACEYLAGQFPERSASIHHGDFLKDDIRAPHGSKTYGILSVLLQAWYDIEFLFRVPPQVFYPPPRVQSAVIRLKRNRRTSLGCDDGIFHRVVKAAFNHRRKTLRNSLKGHFQLSERPHEYFSLRPEQLSVAQFIELACMLANQKSA